MKHNQAELINENVNAALCVNNLCNWTEHIVHWEQWSEKFIHVTEASLSQ